jgi:DNA mismatch repair protein MLH1
MSLNLMQVDWESEGPCFDLIAQELALLYRFESIENVEHTLFPAIRQYLVGQNEMVKNEKVSFLADLPELYKIFERC